MSFISVSDGSGLQIPASFRKRRLAKFAGCSGGGFIPFLLLGSNLQNALRAGNHSCVRAPRCTSLQPGHIIQIE